MSKEEEAKRFLELFKEIRRLCQELEPKLQELRGLETQLAEIRFRLATKDGKARIITRPVLTEMDVDSQTGEFSESIVFTATEINVNLRTGEEREDSMEEEYEPDDIIEMSPIEEKKE